MATDPTGPLKELLADRYRIDHELGRGGFATVYLVWNPRLERSEALKVLAPGHQVDEDFSRRFTQEVRLAAALEHPSIVKVYDFGETGGIYWYSMQLVEGRTLSGEVRERGPLRERETARIAIPLLEALEYSHARGIVHRDIKPENIILDRDGRPFLMDFGVAKSAGSLVKTQTGFLLGTPAYVAPEQAQGRKLDGRADLYAFGVTLYKTVSGEYPFEAGDPLHAVILRLTQPPRPLAAVLPAVDADFAAIVMCALEREPDRRWASAREMRDALAAYLAGRPAETTATRVLVPGTIEAGVEPAPGSLPFEAVAVEPPPPPPPPSPAVRAASRTVVSARRTPSRRSSVLPLAAGVVLLLIVVGVSGLAFIRSTRKSAEEPSMPRAATPGAVPQPPPGPTAVPPAPTPVTAPTAAPASVPTAAPEPTATTIRVIRPTRPPDPAPPAPRKPVTLPERLTPDPPFAGAPPGGCSGAAVTVGFAVDPDGNVVAPRLFPSDAPPECGRFVMDALSRWKWRPAVDAAGAPAFSARLVVYVQLP
jgi:serine/threonine-protein kinase